MAAENTLELSIDWADETRPKYEALQQRLVTAIRSGQFPPGSPLPTEKALAHNLGIARSTVRQAMATLEREGLIRRIQGKGTFVQSEARELIGRTMGLLALIVPETRAGFYPSLIHGFEAAARAQECQAIICNSDNNIDKQGNAILQLIDKKISGVTIVPTSSPRTPTYQIRQLREHGIPVVFCHRAVEGITAPLLALPYRKIGRLAGLHLASQGHRRVAFLSSHHTETMTLYRDGLAAGLRTAGAELRAQDVWHASSLELSPEEADRELGTALDQMLEPADRPTAIFASFDSLAEAIHLHCTQRQLRIPADLSLLGVGGCWREHAFSRQLTSVVVDEEAAARRAVELLAAMIQGDRQPHDDIVIELEAELFAGNTVGAVADTGSPSHAIQAGVEP